MSCPFSLPSLRRRYPLSGDWEGLNVRQVGCGKFRPHRVSNPKSFTVHRGYCISLSYDGHMARAELYNACMYLYICTFVLLWPTSFYHPVKSHYTDWATSPRKYFLQHKVKFAPTQQDSLEPTHRSWNQITANITTHLDTLQVAASYVSRFKECRIRLMFGKG